MCKGAVVVYGAPPGGVSGEVGVAALAGEFGFGEVAEGGGEGAACLAFGVGAWAEIPVGPVDGDGGGCGVEVGGDGGGAEVGALVGGECLLFAGVDDVEGLGW